MSTESIQFNLRERFAAPLPEFYRRRIIFWKDEDWEFEKDVDELNLEGVKIIKLTGTNNFAVKKLLLHDDLESDYLVYCPITYTGDEDNWLQDIEYYSESFRADFISMQMDELNIEKSAAMRKTVKLYAKFLENKERRQKLRKIGRDYQTPLQLHIDIMAVLAGLSEGSAQDVIIAVLAAGLDKETNSVLQNIRTFAGRSPRIESASIVFPEPVSPMTAIRSPEEREKETSCKSTRSPRASFAEIVSQA